MMSKKVVCGILGLFFMSHTLFAATPLNDNERVFPVGTFGMSLSQIKAKAQAEFLKAVTQELTDPTVGYADQISYLSDQMQAKIRVAEIGLGEESSYELRVLVDFHDSLNNRILNYSGVVAIDGYQADVRSIQKDFGTRYCKTR